MVGDERLSCHHRIEATHVGTRIHRRLRALDFSFTDLTYKLIRLYELTGRLTLVMRDFTCNTCRTGGQSRPIRLISPSLERDVWMRLVEQDTCVALDMFRIVLGRHKLEKANTESTEAGASRRTIIKTAAWSVPVIAAAVAVPLASASTTIDIEVPGVDPATNLITNWEGNHEQGTFDGADDAPYLFNVIVKDQNTGLPLSGATVTVTATGISDGNDILAVQAYPAQDGIDPENDHHPTQTLVTDGTGSAKFAVNTANINDGWFPAEAYLTVTVTYNGTTTTFTYRVVITSNS